MTKELEPVRLTTAMLKGGGTRTTSAVFAAIDLARREPNETVLLVDADTQNGTAFEWIDSAADSRPANLTAAYWPVSSFVDRALNYGAKHIVVDTGNDAVGLEQALSLTDHVLLTVKPSGSEISRVRPTLNVITGHPRASALNVGMLITRGKARTRSLAEAQEVLGQVTDARLLSTIIPEWELYAQAYPTIPDELGAYPAALDELLTR